jgi:predicted XRE-type DNA-binding protein
MPIDTQRFASVWDAIEDTPEEAAKMRALSQSRMLLTRQTMANELSRNSKGVPKGKSVMAQLRKEQRY